MTAVFNFIFGSFWIFILLLAASSIVIASYFKMKKDFVTWNFRVQAEAIKSVYSQKNNEDLEKSEPPKNWDSGMTDR